MSNRPQIRQRMIKDRTTSQGVLCDLCGLPIPGCPEMHELIPRRMTVGSNEARQLSFQPELCAILCPGCHYMAEQEENILWEHNYHRHGKDKVLNAFNKLWEVWPVHVKPLEANDGH